MNPMLRPILIHPNPKLKKVCEPVLEIDSTIIELSDDMLETMYHAPGIGLAAPQIGVLNRIIVMDCEKDEAANRKPIVMINPEIVYSSDEESTYEEGCLSIPEQFAEIKRPTSVQVRWLDTNGTEQEQEFQGLWSTCVQHEIDHLDGKLFIDYLGTIKRQLITRKMQKFKREMTREEK